MKLVDFRQTVFVTEDDLNKVCFMFEEFEEGSKIEIFGKKFNIESESMSALIPCVKEKTLAPVTLRLADGSFISYTYTLKPVEKSELCFINLFSGGLPYTDYCCIDKGGMSFTDEAAQICEKFPDFKYAECTPRGSAEKFLINGQFEALPDISGLCTAAADGEAMAEKLRKIKKYRGCANSCETAFIGHASGLSLGAVSYLTGAGIKYAIITPDDFRSSKAPFAAEFFKLTCGSEEIVVYINNPKHRIPDHPKSESVFSAGAELIEYKLFLKNSSTLSEFEDTADKLIGRKKVVSIIEDGAPNLFMKALCDEMSSKWKYPIFSMVTPSEFMRKLVESCGGNMPSVSGEISCPNADDLTGFGSLTAKNRYYSYFLRAANALSLIKATENPANEYRQELFTSVISDISDFSLRNIDFTEKNPIEMHRFNMFYSRMRPLKCAEELTEESFRKFTDRDTGSFITAINTRLRPTNVHLVSPIPPEGLVCQKMDENYITEPVSLPPFGAKSFVEGKYKPGESFALVKGGIIDTGHYRISLNTATGQITSIIENAAMRELIDTSADFCLGDMIYTAGSGEKLDKNIQKCVDFDIESGPLALRITRRGIEEQSRAEITCSITFYKHSKNIDIKLKFSNASALSGDFYDRYEKNIFFAFPLRCEDYRFKSTHATGEIRESKDRLPVGCGDFAVCQRYAAVENNYCGTMLSCREMPVFHFGNIMYGSFSPQPSCTSAHMYLYAASNRANQLIYEKFADGEFNLTMLPYRSNSDELIFSSAESFLYPPKIVKGYSVERSRMAVSEEGISFGSFNRSSDRAFILRVSENLGKSRKITVSVPFNISRAYYSNICEDTGREITEFSENKITAEINASSQLTLKLYPTRDYNITLRGEKGIKSYSYVSHCGRIVAVWDKYEDENRNKYDILCDGEKIAEAKAKNSETQIFMTDVSGEHKITVE